MRKGEFTQYPFLSVFFTFLLLREQICPFSSAILYVHIRTNQTVTYWTKVVQKLFLPSVTALFRNIALIVHTQNFGTKFLSIYNSLLSVDMYL